MLRVQDSGNGDQVMYSLDAPAACPVY